MKRKDFARSIIRPFASLLPTGMVVPIVAGPLKGKLWIIGAQLGASKGISTIFYQGEPAQVDYAIKILDNNKICFDIGANVGFYTLLFSQYAKEVYAFEPLPRNLRYLVRLIEINKITNAKIIPCAISESSRIGRFSEADNPALGALSDDGNALVLVTTCDQFVAETNIVPDLLKIDVEGSELDVLKGASGLLESYHPSILLSVHSDQLRTDCVKFVKEIGYETIVPMNSEQLLEATQLAIQNSQKNKEGF
jgi:FkbM family methyltransferase